MSDDSVGLDVLTVPGRRSGVTRHVPLTVAEPSGLRYVVGGIPAAEWIRNVRATGGLATLACGGGEPEEVRLVEVDAATADTVLRAWPQVTPDGVAMMRDAGVVRDTTPDAVADAVEVCPVCRVQPRTNRGGSDAQS